MCINHNCLHYCIRLEFVMDSTTDSTMVLPPLCYQLQGDQAVHRCYTSHNAQPTTQVQRSQRRTMAPASAAPQVRRLVIVHMNASGCVVFFDSPASRRTVSHVSSVMWLCSTVRKLAYSGIQHYEFELQLLTTPVLCPLCCSHLLPTGGPAG